MRNRAMIIVALCLLVAASAVSALGQEKEKPIKMKDLPPAVKKTVDAQSKGATIKGFNKEVENGKTMYEAEMTVDGHSKDILIDASGAVVEIEEAVTMDSLPDAVKAGLQQAAGSGKILKVESITEGGSLTKYEAVVQKKGGKKHEIQVTADGKPIPQKAVK